MRWVEVIYSGSIHRWSYLLRLSWCRLLDPPAGRSGGGDLHDGCGRLWAIGCGTRLWCDRGGRIPDQPHAALDPNVGIPLCSHVEHFQAIIVEAWKLALKGSTPVSLPAPNLYSGLAVEDCKLPPCRKTMLHIYKNVGLSHFYWARKKKRQKDRLFAQWQMWPINYGL